MVNDAQPLSPPHGDAALLVEAIGPAFFPFDHLNRKLKEKNEIRFVYAASIISSAARIKNLGKGIIVAYVSTEGEILQLAEFLTDLADLIGTQRVGVIAVSRIFIHKIQEMVARDGLTKVFTTAVTGDQLHATILEFSEIIAGRSPKKSFNSAEGELIQSRPVVASKLFLPIQEKTETDRIYQECCTDAAVVTLSSEDLQDRINVTFLKYDSDTNRVWGRGHEIKEFIEAVSKRSVTEDLHLLFSFGLNRSRIFLKTSTRINLDKEASFDLILPQVVFEVQRRTQIRLNCYPNENVQLQFQFANQKARFNAALFDLASGGLSFVTTEEMIPKFKKGTQLQHLKFQLGDRSLFVAEAIVCHASPLSTSGDGKFRVGLVFKIVLARDTAYLGMYVFKRNLDYITKLIG